MGNNNGKRFRDINDNSNVKKKMDFENVEDNVDSTESELVFGSGGGRRYPISLKIKVSKFMKNHSSREASKKFGIPACSAWRWKKFKSSALPVKDQKQRMGNFKSASNGRKPQFYSESFKSEVMNYLLTHSDFEAQSQFPRVPEGTLRFWRRKMNREASVSSFIEFLLDRVVEKILVGSNEKI